MLPLYDDILSRIPESPKWWDEHGVPRFCDPAPQHACSIYASEVIFMEIACQDCHRKFLVEMHSSSMDIVRGRGKLCDQVESKSVHYGDPPRHDNDNCWAGNTMNCIDIRVVEFWRQDSSTQMNWVRVPELEIEIDNLEEWENGRPF